eukprot:3838632-Rhodomonas_salina.1
MLCGRPLWSLFSSRSRRKSSSRETDASPREKDDETFEIVFETPWVPCFTKVFAPSLSDCRSPCRSPAVNARMPVLRFRRSPAGFPSTSTDPKSR